jgi:hypothetical protein
MTERCIRSFALDLNRGEALGGRFPANHFLLEPGNYRIDQRSGTGAYTPFSPSAVGHSPHWYHEVHIGIVPLAGPDPARAVPAAMLHMVLRDADEPGPHPTPIAARDAFRAIPASARSFTLEERSSVVFWVQAGEYGDWEKGRYAYGTMWLQLIEETP